MVLAVFTLQLRHVQMRLSWSPSCSFPLIWPTSTFSRLPQKAQCFGPGGGVALARYRCARSGRGFGMWLDWPSVQSVGDAIRRHSQIPGTPFLFTRVSATFGSLAGIGSAPSAEITRRLMRRPLPRRSMPAFPADTGYASHQRRTEPTPELPRHRSSTRAQFRIPALKAEW